MKKNEVPMISLEALSTAFEIAMLMAQVEAAEPKKRRKYRRRKGKKAKRVAKPRRTRVSKKRAKKPA